jgi:outer membrane protein insertion porin family
MSAAEEEASSSSPSSSPAQQPPLATKEEGEGGEQQQQQQQESDKNNDENLQMQRALIDFRNRYEQLKHNPCFVSEIVVRGNKKTRDKLIKKCFEKRVENCGNLEEIKDELLKGREELEKFNIFKGINVTLDAGSEENYVPNGAKIIVDVAEKDALTLKAGTFVSQSGEGTVEITGGLKNAVGCAEKIDFELIRGHEKSASYALHWEQPRVFQSDVTTALRIFQQHNCSVRHSSFHETGRGLSFHLSSPERPATLEYNLVWREITDPTRFASRAVRKMCGHSLKSSIVHTLGGQSEDDQQEEGVEELGKKGNWWWNVRTELAGLNPVFDSTTEAFVKSECHAKYTRAFPERVNDFLPEKMKQSLSWQIGVRAGIILPLQKEFYASTPTSSSSSAARGSNIADRFFMGGVGSLRMFEPHGAGPCDVRREKDSTLSSPSRTPSSPGVSVSGNLTPPRSVQSSSPYDSVGGDVIVSGTASVKMDIPVEKLRNIGVHGHAFINAGCLIPHDAKVRDTFKPSNFRDSLRASCGAGIVWPLPVGNIELNFGRVLLANSTDRVAGGKFQAGLAASLSA